MKFLRTLFASMPKNRRGNSRQSSKKKTLIRSRSHHSLARMIRTHRYVCVQLIAATKPTFFLPSQSISLDRGKWMCWTLLVRPQMNRKKNILCEIFGKFKQNSSENYRKMINNWRVFEFRVAILRDWNQIRVFSFADCGSNWNMKKKNIMMIIMVQCNRYVCIY